MLNFFQAVGISIVANLITALILFYLAKWQLAAIYAKRFIAPEDGQDLNKRRETIKYFKEMSWLLLIKFLKEEGRN